MLAATSGSHLRKQRAYADQSTGGSAHVVCGSRVSAVGPARCRGELSERARIGSERTEEAADSAGRVLLLRTFNQRLPRTRSRVQVLVLPRDAGVYPGVVVGRLQHDGCIPFSHLNGLRVRFRFARA